MDAQQTRLDVTANNVANVSTAGFKRSRPEFQDLMYQTLRAAGATTGGNAKAPVATQVGMGTRLVATTRMHTEGDLKQTGNALDLAIEGGGFFGVRLPSGEQVYTRDGAFKLDQEGKLVTSDGHPLVGDITIPPEAQQITIGADGTITVTMPREPQPVEVGKLDLFTFANPAGLVAAGRNQFRESLASGAAITQRPGEGGAGTLAQGTIEMSNVKVVEEMVDLISGQRAYEINARVVRAADDMLNETARLR
jgi:flagellar basal-body rod protein FlgG